jgi:hypothetical protein
MEALLMQSITNIAINLQIIILYIGMKKNVYNECGFAFAA